MKKLILFFMFFCTIAIGQPNPHANGNGNSDKDKPCNPHNPNCTTNNVPISGVWILIVCGGLLGAYYLNKKRKIV